MRPCENLVVAFQVVREETLGNHWENSSVKVFSDRVGTRESVTKKSVVPRVDVFFARGFDLNFLDLKGGALIVRNRVRPRALLSSRAQCPTMSGDCCHAKHKPFMLFVSS